MKNTCATNLLAVIILILLVLLLSSVTAQGQALGPDAVCAAGITNQANACPFHAFLPAVRGIPIVPHYLVQDPFTGQVCDTEILAPVNYCGSHVFLPIAQP